jgi:hypothetical protein
MEFLKDFPGKIDHLRTQFGTGALIVHAYERMFQLAGEHPTEESLDNAISQVELELEKGELTSQS